MDVIALGSFGTRDVGPDSDADLLLLTSGSHKVAEQSAQELLMRISELHRLGAPLQVDLRLRPDGGKGLLVRTYLGLRAYDLSSMEMWERFALGHARLIYGSREALAEVIHAAHAVPLTPPRLQELAKMKRRIETERVLPQHVHRNVKLGYGGLSDIEWLVRLTEMRYPTATKAGTAVDTTERIRKLGRASLLNALEVEQLTEAHSHLVRIRNWLYMLDMPGDLIPENPDRLDRLAAVNGFENGNAFLRFHGAITEWVRALLEQTLHGLRA